MICCSRPVLTSMRGPRQKRGNIRRRRRGQEWTFFQKWKTRRKRQTSTDIKREKYANWFYIFSLSALTGTAIYMARDWEPQESEELKKDIDNGYTLSLMYKRFKARFNSMFTYFQEPPFPDLLPPPPPPPYQRPLTLVITLEDFWFILSGLKSMVGERPKDLVLTTSWVTYRSITKLFCFHPTIWCTLTKSLKN